MVPVRASARTSFTGQNARFGAFVQSRGFRLQTLVTLNSRMAHDDDWQREMQRYLAHFNRAGKRPTILFSQHPEPSPVWTPAMDMYETADALVILLDLAGIDAEHTQVHAEPHLLVVRGVRHERHSVSHGEE